jgi:hypothetical protein
MKRNLPILSLCAMAALLAIVALTRKNAGPTAASPVTNTAGADSSVKIIYQPRDTLWTVTSGDRTTFSYQTTNSLPTATMTRNTN